MDPHQLVERFIEVGEAVVAVLEGHDDLGLSGRRHDQYSFDVATDDIAVPLLVDAGVGVLSEESGLHHPDRAVIVALDPVDGSTNYSRGLPWYATSMCAVDARGPLAALVMNLATGTRFTAVRGEGAFCNGAPLSAPSVKELADSIVAINGLPERHLGWRQYRSLGATALDLCAIASGSVDALYDATPGQIAPWDYLGGMLVCTEAGAVVADFEGRDLVTVDHDARRRLIGAATPELFAELSALVTSG